MNISKVENIAGGTTEACRLVIYRTAVRQMAEELKIPQRVIHEELRVPVPASAMPEKKSGVDEVGLLEILAKDYPVNPGLHMSREDMKSYFDVNDEKLDEVLVELEDQGLVKLYRDKKGIALAKATYEGLGRAFPKEHYRWFPDWVTQGNIF